MNIHAIIPARSGSKRFPNKNISNFMGTPLFQHSINFASKLNFISKIILSTDSKRYVKVTKSKSNIIFHKRSIFASKDNSMEEDILIDLKNFYKKKKIKYPDAVLWLRPTHPLRSIEIFRKGFNLFKRKKKTVMIIHKAESRLFMAKNNLIYPINKEMTKKSMIRSQDCKPLFKIFSGEYFKFPKKYSKNFLGKSKYYVVAPKETDFDIDEKKDLKILEIIAKNNFLRYKNYLHK